MLIDTNGDGIPDSRQFAGTHRYNTAVALAERFASDEGSISTVIIASGESQVDAVTAAGLAGNLNAPVLLTRSSMLPHNVARFIDEQNVTDVIIVGGTAAVPDSVATAIEGLGSRPTVDRIGEADRYATAAAIGSRLGGPNPTWCNSTQTAAILVNGGDAGRADAIVAGPLAFRLGLPILLTMADEVPESTAAFLTDNKVERVVVIGGTSAVSAGVRNSLVEDIGVVNVHPIDGGSAAATSVMVAKEMLGNCADVLQTDPDRVALVNRDATADGIAAAPVLGRGLGNGPVPILLVDDELPASVSDYLAGTVEARPGHGKTHQRIVAIGGTAVVSNSVMADAVAAAKTSSALTAEITVKVDPVTKVYKTWSSTDCDGDGTADATASVCGGEFTVTFSDNVREPVSADAVIDDAERHGTALDPTMYRVNGRRVEAAASAANPVDENATLADLVFTANRTVTVRLSHILEPGDTITVDNSLNEGKGLRLGAGGDKRKLEPAELTLGPVSPPRDTTAPAVEIIAVPGLSYFDVIVTEPNLILNELGTVNAAGALTAVNTSIGDYVEISGGLIPAGEKIPAATEGAANTPRSVSVSTTLHGDNATLAVGGSDGTIRMRFGISVTNPTTPALIAQIASGTLTSTHNMLRAGDVIMIKGNAFIDQNGRRNRLVQYTVPKVRTDTVANLGTGALQIDSVSIGDYVHTNQANAIFPSSTTPAANTLKITALPTGVAAGAAGNSWVIYGYDDRQDGSVSSYAFDIDVDVDIANQRIAYTISDVLPRRPLVGRVNNDGATIGDLAVALVSNSDFAANFTVEYGGSGPPTQSKGSLLGATGPAGVGFGDDSSNEEVGRTSVGVVVKFNGDIAELRDEAGSAITASTTTNVALAYDIAPSAPVPFQKGLTLGQAATNANPNAYDVKFVAPDDVVHISYTADSMAKLPQRAGFRIIAAKVAVGYPDNTLRRLYGFNGAGAARTAYVVGDTDLSRADNSVTPTAAGVLNDREILNSLRPDSRIKHRAVGGG